jgi:hypothetical protein
MIRRRDGSSVQCFNPIDTRNKYAWEGPITVNRTTHISGVQMPEGKIQRVGKVGEPYRTGLIPVTTPTTKTIG